MGIPVEGGLSIFAACWAVRLGAFVGIDQAGRRVDTHLDAHH